MNKDRQLPLGPGAEFDIVGTMLSRWGALAPGIGDDAALLDVPAGSRLVVSTDTSVENVHFKRAWLSPEEIAYRAVAAALSDSAAMGAAPLGMVIALTLTEQWRAQIVQLADGLANAADEFGAPIVGGDLSAGSELSIGVTVLGSVEKPLTRAGARAGDTLWVTGQLGGALLALRALENGTVPAPAHRNRFAHPVPRIKEGQWLVAHGATSGIDCSDGVAADTAHLVAASGAKIVLELDRLPLIEGATPEIAAESGEEYELIVTAPATLDRAVFEREFGIPITAIGRVESVGALAQELITQVRGSGVPFPRGHSHFSG